jgi:hypothetical protein
MWIIRSEAQGAFCPIGAAPPRERKGSVDALLYFGFVCISMCAYLVIVFVYLSIFLSIHPSIYRIYFFLVMSTFIYYFSLSLNISFYFSLSLSFSLSLNFFDLISYLFINLCIFCPICLSPTSNIAEHFFVFPCCFCLHQSNS